MLAILTRDRILYLVAAKGAYIYTRFYDGLVLFKTVLVYFLIAFWIKLESSSGLLRIIVISMSNILVLFKPNDSPDFSINCRF